MTRPQTEMEQLRAAVGTINDTVQAIFQDWPVLLKTLGSLSTQQAEHERRIQKLEGRVFVSPPNGVARFTSTPPSGMGGYPSGKHRFNPTDTGSHTIIEDSKTGRRTIVSSATLDKEVEHAIEVTVERFADAGELATWRWLKKHGGKLASHAITTIVVGGLTLLWHYLKTR
jgi:hypothetical protein